MSARQTVISTAIIVEAPISVPASWSTLIPYHNVSQGHNPSDDSRMNTSDEEGKGICILSFGMLFS
jgi:hypothetical protein